MAELIQQGGVIIVVIIALSIVAVAIIIERLIYFRKIMGDEEALLRRLRSTLEKGHFDEALSICDSNQSPITNLMKVGIEHKDYSEETIKQTVTDAASLEVPRMERHLSTLGTIAHISPLLGLLGTVTGNIQAFGVLGEFGAVGDPSLLATGIAEALLTTAAGIIVSIPAIIFYNYLVSKVNHYIIRLENRVSEMVMLLKGPEQSSADYEAVSGRSAAAGWNNA